MEEIVNIHVKLLHKGTNAPVNGGTYEVRFYDQDLIEDDILGASSIDEKGVASVPIVRSDFRSVDSPLEVNPDIYFTVEKEGKVIFKSPVYRDLHLKEHSEFSFAEGLHCDLGTFIIE